MKRLLGLLFLCSSHAWAGPPSGGTVPFQTNPANLARLNLGINTASAVRNPGIADNSAAGHALTDLWLGGPNIQGGNTAGSLGGQPLVDLPTVWQAQRVTGNAVWLPIAVTALAGDLNTPLIAYGVCKQVAAYSGNAMTLTRASDSTTKNLAYVGNPACVDYQSGDAFCAGTTCTITTIYDNTANGYNCTSPVAHAPLWQNVKTINGFRPILFASFHNALSGGSNPAATQVYCQISGSASWSLGTSTFLITGQVMNNGNNEANTILIDGNNQYGYISGFNGGGTTAVGMAVTGKGRYCGLQTEDEPTVFGVATTSTGPAIACYVGNQISSGTNGGFTSSAVAGGYLGSPTASSPGQMSMLSFTLWNSSLTQTQVRAAQASLMQQFRIPFQYDDVIDCDGDSQVSGDGSVAQDSWCQMLPSIISRPVRLYNDSYFGAVLCSGTLPLFTNAVGSNYRSYYRNFIVILDDGGNDIAGGATAATVEACLQTYVNNVHALGAANGGNAKIYVTSRALQCIFASPGSIQTQLQLLNNWILANGPQSSGGLGADGIIDLFGDPTVGPGVYNNLAINWYCPNGSATNQAGSLDGNHPTVLTDWYYAWIAAKAIQNVLQ